MKGRCEHFLDASDIQDASPIIVPVVVGNSTVGREAALGVFHRTPKITSVSFDSCTWDLTNLIPRAGNGTAGCAYAFRGFALSATATTQSLPVQSTRLPAGLSLLAAGSIKYDPQAADAEKNFSVDLQADLQDETGRRTRHTLFSLQISVISADAPSKNQHFDAWFDSATRTVNSLRDDGRIIDGSVDDSEHQINITMYAGRRVSLPGFTSSNSNGNFWDGLVCEDFRTPGYNSTPGYQWMFTLEAAGEEINMQNQNKIISRAVDPTTGNLTVQAMMVTGSTRTTLTTWDNGQGLHTYTLYVTVLPLPSFAFNPSVTGADSACQTKLQEISNRVDGKQLPAGETLTAPDIFTDDDGGCGTANFGSVMPTFKLCLGPRDDCVGDPAPPTVPGGGGDEDGDGRRFRQRSRSRRAQAANVSQGYLVNPVTGAFSITPTTAGNIIAHLLAVDDMNQSAAVLHINVSWVIEEAEASAEGDGVDAITIVMSVIAGLLFVLVIAVGLRHLKARAELMAAKNFSTLVRGLNLDDSGSNSPDDRVIPTELKRSGVRLIKEIGSGEFGLVWKGMYRAPKTSISHELHVAIKELQNDPSAHEREELMREAAITAQFDHPNVVGLIGVVTAGEPALLVLQFCDKGSLSSMLQDQDASAPLRVDMLVGYCLGAVTGMSYLAERYFLHRDLAARNVLVNAYNEAMIADFGLSRDVLESEYYKSVDSNAKLPLRWTSIEAIKHQRFSEKSDVWAFGVTCFEIFTDGQLPYREWMNWYVMEMVCEREYKLPRPPRCPVSFYENALRPCLETLPADRPTFAELTVRVKAVADLTARVNAVAESDVGVKPNSMYYVTSSDTAVGNEPGLNDKRAHYEYVEKPASSQQDAPGLAQSDAAPNTYLLPAPVSDIVINQVGAAGGEYVDHATTELDKQQSKGETRYGRVGVAGNPPVPYDHIHSDSGRADGGKQYAPLSAGAALYAPVDGQQSQQQYVPLSAASKGGAALYAPVDGQQSQQQYVPLSAASKGGAALYAPVEDTFGFQL